MTKVIVWYSGSFYLSHIKKTIVIGLTVLTLFFTFKDVFTLIYFHVNRSYIVAELCENREKPELACEGKCYLDKSLKKNSEQEREPFQTQKNVMTFVFLTPLLEDLFAKSKESLEQERVSYFEKTYAYSYLQDIFHPPQVN